MEALAALILAGGRGRRMGGADKGRLQVEGQPILVRLAAALSELSQEILVVGAPPGAYRDLGLASLPDEVPGAGPAMGLATGLAAMRAPLAFVCAADMPWVQPAVVRRMLERLGGHEAAVCRVGGRPQPLHALYRKGCLEAARRHPGGAMRQVVAGLDVAWVEEEDLRDIPHWERSFCNINTPQDLVRLAGGIPPHREGPGP
jgi:molybdopterin-guanine dinucleotide biosynthesis protein A